MFMKEQNQSELTKHIRLIVYSYLDVGTVLKKVSILSKQERDQLKNSTIAREGKKQGFEVGELLREECLLHGDIFDRVMSKIKMGLSLCEHIELKCCRDMVASC